MQQQHIGHYQELRGGPFLIRYTDENGNERYYVLHWATLCEALCPHLRTGLSLRLRQLSAWQATLRSQGSGLSFNGLCCARMDVEGQRSLRMMRRSSS